MKDKKDSKSSDSGKLGRNEIPLHLTKEALDKLIQEKFKRAELYSKGLSTR